MWIFLGFKPDLRFLRGESNLTEYGENYESFWTELPGSLELYCI